MIDLRSDLLVSPTEAMWEAMRSAELGWATFGEDPSVNALEGRVAELLGKESALWVPTCGMANLLALSVLAPDPRPVVLEATAHILTSEGMWLTQIAGHAPVSLWAVDGRPRPDQVEQLVRRERAAVLCLENTHTRAGGSVLSVPLTEALAEAAHAHGARVHLDGARLVNAAVALNVDLRALAAPADTVALSLNKGLGAPMGAVLAGTAGLVADARPLLQRLGGASLHRAGIPAAAALVALDEGLGHIADDHRRAADLARGVAVVEGLALRPARVETNIVLVDVSGVGVDAGTFIEALAERGVRAMERDGARIRLVTHHQVGDADVERAVEAIAATADALRSSRGVAPEPFVEGPADGEAPRGGPLLVLTAEGAADDGERVGYAELVDPDGAAAIPPPELADGGFLTEEEARALAAANGWRLVVR